MDGDDEVIAEDAEKAPTFSFSAVGINMIHRIICRCFLSVATRKSVSNNKKMSCRGNQQQRICFPSLLVKIKLKDRSLRVIDCLQLSSTASESADETQKRLSYQGVGCRGDVPCLVPFFKTQGKEFS